MKIFRCDHCDNLVFFENVECVNCKHRLGFLPDLFSMGSLEAVADDLWRSPNPQARGRTYRLCKNYSQENVCNWVVPTQDPNPLCASCRLTRVIPDLYKLGHREKWYRLEVAKRRLIYSLLSLRLPVKARKEGGEGGLIFEFLADPETPGAPPVLTGHNKGLITINVAEADDATREKRRVHLAEPYRTLLGHFRHEIGHYYWDRLIEDSDWLDEFRQLFGDERANYNEALQAHYRNGPPENWQQQFVSAYASSHPWEDWAESWAHYLHMTDTLEIAHACGLVIKPRRPDEPALKPAPDGKRRRNFDDQIADWFALTYVLNNLNRGMGIADGYPFVLSTLAIEKIQFIHDVVTQAGQAAALAAQEKASAATA